MNRSRFAILLLLLAPCAPFARAGEKIVVVMSSQLGPYQEALSGVQAELGKDVAVFNLADNAQEIPVDSRTVIAIGGKAALHPYPVGTRIVYCLAPGLELPRRSKSGATYVEVEVSPTLQSMVRRFKDIQPSLKRLGVLWISNSMHEFLEESDAIRATLGVEIVPAHIRGADDLPEALRRLQGKVDALWLAPDPPLISLEILSTIKGFSWTNHVPFYVPSDGLAANGALAAVSSSFGDMGRTAAKVAQSIIAGKSYGETIFPDISKTTFNLGTANELHMSVDQRLVGKGDQVNP